MKLKEILIYLRLVFILAAFHRLYLEQREE